MSKKQKGSSVYLSGEDLKERLQKLKEELKIPVEEGEDEEEVLPQDDYTFLSIFGIEVITNFQLNQKDLSCIISMIEKCMIASSQVISSLQISFSQKNIIFYCPRLGPLDMKSKMIHFRIYGGGDSVTPAGLHRRIRYGLLVNLPVLSTICEPNRIFTSCAIYYGTGKSGGSKATEELNVLISKNDLEILKKKKEEEVKEGKESKKRSKKKEGKKKKKKKKKEKELKNQSTEPDFKDDEEEMKEKEEKKKKKKKKKKSKRLAKEDF